MRTWMRVVGAVAVVVGVACCGGRSGTRPAAEAAGPEYRTAYSALMSEVKTGMDEGRCTVARTCGELQFVDCGQAADGPAYYVDSKRGTVLEVCGGACMGPERGAFCKACPPPEWSCSE